MIIQAAMLIVFSLAVFAAAAVAIRGAAAQRREDEWLTASNRRVKDEIATIMRKRPEMVVDYNPDPDRRWTRP